jgi:hypothetical protein
MGNPVSRTRGNQAGWTLVKTVVVIVVLAALVAIVIELRTNFTFTGNFVSPTKTAISAGTQAGFYYLSTKQATLTSAQGVQGRPVTFMITEPLPDQAKIVTYQDDTGLHQLPAPVDMINAVTDSNGRITVFVKADSVGPGFGLSATDTSPGCIGCTTTAKFQVTP